MAPCVDFRSRGRSVALPPSEITCGSRAPALGIFLQYEHPDTLRTRGNLAFWAGVAGTRPPPGTCSPRCCRGVSGSSAPIPGHREHPASSSPAGPGRRGTRPPPGTCSPRCCRCVSGSSARNIRTHCAPAVYLARWTGEAGDPAAARNLFAALLPEGERVLAAEHPDLLHGRRETRPLDRGGGGPGRRPGPVRRAAAGA